MHINNVGSSFSFVQIIKEQNSIHLQVVFEERQVNYYLESVNLNAGKC